MQVSVGTSLVYELGTVLYTSSDTPLRLIVPAIAVPIFLLLCCVIIIVLLLVFRRNCRAREKEQHQLAAKLRDPDHGSCE